MEQKEMIDLLRQVASGTMDVEQAALKLKEEPFEDLGFAKIDHHRAMRQGCGRSDLWRRKDTGTDFPDCRSNEGKGTESSPDHKNE